VPARPEEEPARVVVRVPEDARLEFEGVVVPETGRVRKFVTPALVPGKKLAVRRRAVRPHRAAAPRHMPGIWRRRGRRPWK
jgi:hypothetical protein